MLSISQTRRTRHSLPLFSLFVLMAASCGSKTDSVSTTLAPGQSALVTLNISDPQGSQISSCTSETIDTSDARTQLALQNMSVEVTSFEVSSLGCSVQASVTADTAATAGGYRVKVDVDYDFVDSSGDAGANAVAGYIDVKVN